MIFAMDASVEAREALDLLVGAGQMICVQREDRTCVSAMV